MTVCTVDGCHRRHSARGLCRTHYQRWYLHGTPDTSTPIRPRSLVRCPVCWQDVPRRNGELPAVRLGGRVLIDRHDLDHIIDTVMDFRELGDGGHLASAILDLIIPEDEDEKGCPA